MRYVRLIAMICLSGSLLVACSATTNPNNTSTSQSDATKSGDSTYTGTSSLSYTTAGRKVAIKDYMHDGDGKNWLALINLDVKNDAANGVVKINVGNQFTSEVFNFTVANKGSSTISHFSPTLSNFADKKSYAGTYMSPKFVNYYADSVVVNITGIDDKHVAGTFSGKFLSDKDKSALEITDGKFDVKFSVNNQ